MEKDFLSLVVNSDRTKASLRSIVGLALTVIILTTIYAVFHIVNLYQFFKAAPPQRHNLPHYFYDFRVQPAIAFLTTLGALLVNTLTFVAYKRINIACEGNDEAGLANGFGLLKTIFIVGVINLSLIALSYGYGAII